MIMEEKSKHSCFLNHATKLNYRLFLEEAKGKFRFLAEKTHNSIYLFIYEQLADIEENVIRLQVYTEWDEINKAYSLGAIAVNNFDENDEVYKCLTDIFYGAIKYSTLP